MNLKYLRLLSALALLVFCGAFCFMEPSAEEGENIEMGEFSGLSSLSRDHASENIRGKQKKRTILGLLSLAFKESITRKVVFIFIASIGIWFILMKIGIHAQIQEYKRVVEACNAKLKNNPLTCYSEYEENFTRMGVVRYNELFGGRNLTSEKEGYLCWAGLAQPNATRNNENHDIVKEFSRMAIDNVFAPVNRYIENNFTLERSEDLHRKEIEKPCRVIEMFVSMKKKKIQPIMKKFLQAVLNRLRDLKT